MLLKRGAGGAARFGGRAAFGGKIVLGDVRLIFGG